MAKQEFEVIITRSGSQAEHEQAYREAICFVLCRLPESIRKLQQTRPNIPNLQDGQGR
ncbi:hypothetical protein [Syntrophothermus sp.]|uniref:hypothetical protein n=1 Tax=Syntrophothermus sp. TaxID=2736299 RepID=UPI00257FAFF5|nr:hypothetical protein [Syntrophothermus sp.]